MSVVVTRMQDLASEFSKDTPGPPQREGRPSSAPTSSFAGRGEQATHCWDPNLGPLNFSAVVAPPKPYT